MDILFYLSNPTDIQVVYKLAGLALAIAILWWLLTLIFAHARGVGKEREVALHIDLARHHALIVTFALLQLYILALLNWNLGVFGSPCLQNPLFYARFSPELFLLSLCLILIIVSHRSLLRSVPDGRRSNDDN